MIRATSNRARATPAAPNTVQTSNAQARTRTTTRVPTGAATRPQGQEAAAFARTSRNSLQTCAPGTGKPTLPPTRSRKALQVSFRFRGSVERRKSRRPANHSPPESAKSAHSVAVTGSRPPHTQRQIHAEMFVPPRQSRMAFLNSCWHKTRSWSHSPPVKCFSSTGKARASPNCPSAQTARLRARSACFGDSTYAIKANTRSPCSS